MKRLTLLFTLIIPFCMLSGQTSAEYVLGISRLFSHENNLVKAIEYSTRSINLDPKAEAYAFRSELYFLTGDTCKACDDLARAAMLGDFNSEAQYLERCAELITGTNTLPEILFRNCFEDTFTIGKSNDCTTGYFQFPGTERGVLGLKEDLEMKLADFCAEQSQTIEVSFILNSKGKVSAIDVGEYPIDTRKKALVRVIENEIKKSKDFIPAEYSGSAVDSRFFLPLNLKGKVNDAFFLDPMAVQYREKGDLALEANDVLSAVRNFQKSIELEPSPETLQKLGKLELTSGDTCAYCEKLEQITSAFPTFQYSINDSLLCLYREINGSDISIINKCTGNGVVSREPAFPGGEKERIAYLARNVKIPASTLIKRVQGDVIVGFTVDCDGSIANVKLLKGVDKPFDEEAIRVVESMPKWNPGLRNGIPVKSSKQMSIGVKFKVF